MVTHLSPPQRDFHGGEFAPVIALSFGLWITSSLDAAFAYSYRPVEFGDAGLAGLVGYELVFGVLIAFILRARGRRWSDFDFHYSHGTTIFGVILGSPLNELKGSMLWVAIVSIVNPLFEEILVLGYVIQAMRKRFGLTMAMHVSIAIRLLYHLYQGPLAVIPIAVFGVLATLVYVLLGRLWPVVVAHGVLDFVAIGDLV